MGHLHLAGFIASSWSPGGNSNIQCFCFSLVSTHIKNATNYLDFGPVTREYEMAIYFCFSLPTDPIHMKHVGPDIHR